VDIDSKQHKYTFFYWKLDALAALVLAVKEFIMHRSVGPMFVDAADDRLASALLCALLLSLKELTLVFKKTHLKIDVSQFRLVNAFVGRYDVDRDCC
jgi:hypothetical protein